MRFFPYRVCLAYGVAAVLCLLASVFPVMGAESDAGQKKLQQPTTPEAPPGKTQAPPAGQHDPPKKNAVSTREKEEAVRAKQEAERLRTEKQERKEQERAAAREAAALARDEAARAKQEAQERKNLERAAPKTESRDTRAASPQDTQKRVVAPTSGQRAVSAEPDTLETPASKAEKAERLRTEKQEREELERAAALARDEAARAKKEAQERQKKERAAPRTEPRDTRAASPQGTPKRAVAATPEQIEELAYNVGLYAYPLVLADAVRQADAQAARSAGNVDLSRQFFHSGTVPDSKRAAGILPRADSLYSLAWLELKNTPYLLEIPAMPGRHYLVQLLDAWTRNLPAINARNTDGKRGKYIVLLQGEQIPADYTAEYTPIFCPTSLCMLVARIQVREPADVSAAREAQQGLRLAPLFPDKLTGRTQHAATAPVRQLAALDAEAFFSRFTGLLADNPASDRDARMMRHLVRLGIVKGQDVFFSLEEPLRKAATEGCRRALAGMGVYFNNMSAYHDPMDMGANGWNMSVLDMGTYGERYDMRSHLAAADFGASRPQDVLQATLRVDANGKFLDGEQNYMLRFAPGQLPPVGAFWSLTLYTAKQQLHDNKTQRYALTDSSKLVAEADGSITIYLQHKEPSRKYRANWLPTPPLGYFSLVLRLYAPEPRALQADWHPPKIMPGKSRTVWDSPARDFE